MQKASQCKLQHPGRVCIPWFRALLLEAKRSDLATIFVKTPNRKKRWTGRREIIQLLCIIFASSVAVMAGLYLGLTYHDEH